MGLFGSIVNNVAHKLEVAREARDEAMGMSDEELISRFKRCSNTDKKIGYGAEIKARGIGWMVKN